MGAGCAVSLRVHNKRRNPSFMSKEARCALGQDGGAGACAFSPQTHCPTGSVAGTRTTWVWWVVLPSGSQPTPSSPPRPARTHCPGALQAAEVCDRAPHLTALGMTSSSPRRHVAGEKLPACAVQGQVQTLAAQAACSPGFQSQLRLPSRVMWGQVLDLSLPRFLCAKWGVATGPPSELCCEDGTSWHKRPLSTGC